MPILWQERFAEGVLEIVAAFEIVAAVVGVFGEEMVINHDEYDFAEIFAGPDAPFVQNSESHGAVFLQSVVADAVEQFIAADVADVFLFLFRTVALGEFEGFSQENVGVAMIARIGVHDFFQGVFEINGLHGSMLGKDSNGRMGGAPGFDGQTGQQQAEGEAEDKLFLGGQMFHLG